MELHSQSRRIAYLTGHLGFAIVGASCGLFVAAWLAKGDVDTLNSLTVTVFIVAFSALGFYLGIELPALGSKHRFSEIIQLASATGTLLVAIAVLLSVSGLIFDEDPVIAVVGSSWAIGVALQVAGGVLARQRTLGLSSTVR